MADPGPATAHDERARSTPGLVQDVISQISMLVRSEVDLARAEMQENVNRAATAVGLLVGALILLLTALNVLAAAIVAGLAELGLGAGWAALVVGLALALIAVIMLRKGQNDLKASSLAPTRTAKNLKRDAYAVKEATDGH
ncbi:phage holin family protein [Roseitranquillus sediminis]|uniref:phage holin family protein n=1 Tax=Roseitranquillus sediminis TaxID=2809051 RepID=UPI001D0C3CEA|nr:phage holin family protein [Roseitranquillus sediminis]MBM9593249.1 phage holin family protein [Roseitranquillus sediminis]